MATIGLSKPFYAVYANTGTTVSYSNGGVLGKAVELSMELEDSEGNVFYADNGPAENETSFAGGTLTITTDDLYDEPAATVLGLQTLEISTPETASEVVYNDQQNAPYVGFGAIVKKKQNGAYKYMGVVFPKVQFRNPGLTAVTQGEEIEWQTPELSAAILRSDDEQHSWQRHALFSTEANAEAYIKGLLNIT